jgi:hypothetical protein
MAFILRGPSFTKKAIPIAWNGFFYLKETSNGLFWNKTVRHCIFVTDEGFFVVHIKVIQQTFRTI